MDGTETLPVIYVRGRTHYDIGRAIGAATKHWINDYMCVSEDVALFRRFYNTSSGKDIVTNYISTATKYRPDVVAEVRGLADGSGQDFHDIFLLQVSSEIMFCHAPHVLGIPDHAHTEPAGCTDILINTETSRLIGHNDDWTYDVASRVCIVHVTIEGDSGDVIAEQFVSYIYPGYLPGFCFGMNKDLVISLNSLTPSQANVNGVPLLVLLRSLLSCASVDECVTAMESKPVGCAYGMNINIAAINKKDVMCSMEVYPEEKRSRMHVQWLSPDKLPFIDHENIYMHTADTTEHMDGRGSKRRHSRVLQLTPATSVNDVINILGDTEDDREPIYRTPNEAHFEPNDMTSATAIFDVTNRVLMVYRCNPKNVRAPLITIPFLS